MKSTSQIAAGYNGVSEVAKPVQGDLNVGEVRKVGLQGLCGDQRSVRT
jgi:hypothetical protein